MISKFLTKYGLSAHLALLAALPLALTPFVSAAVLGTVILWLSAFAAVWLFVEPSILPGEHLSQSRARVRSKMLRDPVFYFFLLVLIVSLVQWLNSGIRVYYDPEQTVWLVREPTFKILPASANGAGFLPFTVALGALIVVTGIRHTLGLGARISFGVIGSMIAGLGGIAAAVCACSGTKPFVDLASSGFDKGPFGSAFFGTWLILGLASGVAAEARKWKMARLPFCLAIMGNVSGLLFFSPPWVAVGWSVAAILVAAWGLFYLGRAGSMGAVARSLSLMVLGIALPVFLLVSFSPETVTAAKLKGFDSAYVMTEAMRQNSEALSRIGRQMWMKHPWSGVGLGAYGLHLPFLAEKADWSVMAAHPLFAQNSYWTLLAERGIVGCLLMVLGVGLMLWYWVSRFIESYLYLRHNDDADIFVFAVPPIVWTLPIVLALVLVESVWLPDFSLPTLVLALVVPLSLCAVSFPRGKTHTSAGDVSNAETPA